jgi:anti-anti-sigma factor
MAAGSSAGHTTGPARSEGAPSANVPVDEVNPRVAGDLDLATTEHLRPAVFHHIETTDSAGIVIDLTELRYLSSCGIAL